MTCTCNAAQGCLQIVRRMRQYYSGTCLIWSPLGSCRRLDNRGVGLGPEKVAILRGDHVIEVARFHCVLCSKWAPLDSCNHNLVFSFRLHSNNTNNITIPVRLTILLSETPTDELQTSVADFITELGFTLRIGTSIEIFSMWIITHI